MVPFNSAVNDTCCDVCSPTRDGVIVNLVTLNSKHKETKSELKGKSLRLTTTFTAILWVVGTTKVYEFLANNYFKTLNKLKPIYVVNCIF